MASSSGPPIQQPFFTSPSAGGAGGVAGGNLHMGTTAAGRGSGGVSPMGQQQTQYTSPSTEINTNLTSRMDANMSMNTRGVLGGGADSRMPGNQNPSPSGVATVPRPRPPPSSSRGYLDSAAGLGPAGTDVGGASQHGRGMNLPVGSLSPSSSSNPVDTWFNTHVVRLRLVTCLVWMLPICALVTFIFAISSAVIGSTFLGFSKGIPSHSSSSVGTNEREWWQEGIDGEGQSSGVFLFSMGWVSLLFQVFVCLAGITLWHSRFVLSFAPHYFSFADKSHLVNSGGGAVVAPGGGSYSRGFLRALLNTSLFVRVRVFVGQVIGLIVCPSHFVYIVLHGISGLTFAMQFVKWYAIEPNVTCYYDKYEHKIFSSPAPASSDDGTPTYVGLTRSHECLNENYFFIVLFGLAYGVYFGFSLLVNNGHVLSLPSIVQKRFYAFRARLNSCFGSMWYLSLYGTCYFFFVYSVFFKSGLFFDVNSFIKMPIVDVARAIGVGIPGHLLNNMQVASLFVSCCVLSLGINFAFISSRCLFEVIFVEEIDLSGLTEAVMGLASSDQGNPCFPLVLCLQRENNSLLQHLAFSKLCRIAHRRKEDRAWIFKCGQRRGEGSIWENISFICLGLLQNFSQELEDKYTFSKQMAFSGDSSISKKLLNRPGMVGNMTERKLGDMRNRGGINESVSNNMTPSQIIRKEEPSVAARFANFLAGGGLDENNDSNDRGTANNNRGVENWKNDSDNFERIPGTTLRYDRPMEMEESISSHAVGAKGTLSSARHIGADSTLSKDSKSLSKFQFEHYLTSFFFVNLDSSRYSVQIQMLAADALSYLACASYEEDRIGVVQHQLPDVFTCLLAEKMAVEKVIRTGLGKKGFFVSSYDVGMSGGSDGTDEGGNRMESQKRPEMKTAHGGEFFGASSAGSSFGTFGGRGTDSVGSKYYYYSSALKSSSMPKKQYATEHIAVSPSLYCLLNILDGCIYRLIVKFHCHLDNLDLAPKYQAKLRSFVEFRE
eukprot:Nk52_evm19s1178 gene=Nk52_evmTU19s1178